MIEENTQGEKKKFFYKKCKEIWISWIYVKRNSDSFLKQVLNLRYLTDIPKKGIH